jgi:hypothetical protein
MGGACSVHWELGNAYILVENSEGKTPLEMPRRRWKDDIKMEFRE